MDCPHCRKSIGGAAREGGHRIRVGIVLVDPADGTVHGPCPHCKEDVVIANGATLSKALLPAPRRGRRRLVPAIRVQRD